MNTRQTRLVLIEGTQPAESRVVRPELNLEQWSGLFIPSQARGRKNELRILEQVETLPGGLRTTKTVEIDPSVKLGTLTAKDQRVLYALFFNWCEKGKPFSYCYYSTYRLAQILKANTSGPSLDSILDSLRRLHAVTITFKRCFHNAETGEIEEDEEPIHILSELKIRSRKKLKDGTYQYLKSEGYLAFHSRILKNLIKQYTRPVLFDVVLSLNSDIAQFIYSIVDRQLSTKANYNILSKSIIDEIGIEGKDYRYVSARMRALKAPLLELVGKPLSSGGFLRITQRETKDKKDVVLIFSKRDKTATTKPKSEKRPDPNEKELVARMVEELGISLTVSRTLEASNAQACLDWCEAKKHGKEHKDKGAGFFVKAILEGWELPTDYKGIQERAKRRANEEKIKQREQGRQAHRQKHQSDFIPFALAELGVIREQHQEAFAKFEESLSDELKNFERFGLSEERRQETTIFHAEWFFNDGYWHKYQIPFMTFWEWDAQRNQTPFQD